VVQDGDRIYGGGVNVAARIEGLADPGGVSISRSAYDQIMGKLALGYEYLGDHEVKNIKNPVRVYKVLIDPGDAGKLLGEKPGRAKKKWFLPIAVVAAIIVTSIVWYFYQNVNKPDIEPASVEEMAYPLPDKPSIAVLAFDNLSGDPEQEYFSDGISENIITALSKVGELFVIARNSSFTYKDKPVKVQQISEELGVQYVLEGSVQKSGDRVRITAQLIDAKNGQHLWAENYDRDLKDIFEIQDEITMEIITALRVELTEGEQFRVTAKQFKSIDVYLKQAQVNSLWNKGTKESLMRYGQLAQEIIDLEPDSPAGYRLLGWYHYGLVSYGDSPQENLKKAFMLSQKALAMDKSTGYPHALLGYIYLRMKEYEKAIESGMRAVGLDPNSAFFKVLLGSTLNDAGRIDEGITHLKQAIRLNPFPTYYYYYHLGRCYLQKGQYEDALKEYKKALQRAPKAAHIHASLAITYILLDREEEARSSAAKSLELAPWITVGLFSKLSTVKNQAFNELVADAMRKAGYPEGE
jgi:adenylate cyclase